MKKYLFVILSLFLFSSFRTVFASSADSQGYYYYSGTVYNKALRKSEADGGGVIDIGTQVLFRSKSATVADHGSYASHRKEIWRNNRWEVWYGGYISNVSKAESPKEDANNTGIFDFSGLFGFFQGLFDRLLNVLNNLLNPLWEFLRKLFEIKDFKMPSFKPFLNINLRLNTEGFRVFGRSMDFSIIDEWGRIAWLAMAVPSLINTTYALAKGEN